ncbi:MAG: tRNA lysidine(34) synthetase TilS [Thiohalorhabdus sp.]|uniref:tRNA lysidine(34) synthetase TilS n=1 Tax=Thiohalorhabdus sp. TaxID=3094134 RepID=UPI0039800325
MLPKHPLRDRFLTRLDAHLRRDLAVPEGASLRVAFSGGTDSTALLAAVAALAPVRGYRVAAVHVHHGMAADADAWAATCAATCERLGIPLEQRRWEGAVSPGESPEAAARAGRYALFEDALAPGEWLLTAHQADDQAETVLLFLARGAGLDGLAGIQRKRPFGSGWLARPLLPFTRIELEGFVAGLGLSIVADPTNRDPRLARARVRHRLLPCLEEVMGAGVAGAVTRSADLLQDARAVVEEAVAEHLGRVRPDPDRPAELQAPALADLGPPLARHVLRAALREAALPLPERAVLEQVRDLAAADRAAGSVAWDGGAAHRSGTRLLLTAEPGPQEAATPDAWAPAEGPLRWTPLGLTLWAEQETAQPPWPAPEEAQVLDAEAAGPVFGVRTPRPGDRIRPAGGGTERPLGELLRGAGIPVGWRERVPLLTDGAGRILAVVGVATAAAGAARPGRPAWRIRLDGWKRPWPGTASGTPEAGDPGSGTREQREGE